LKGKEGILQDGNAAMSKRTTIRLKLLPASGVLMSLLAAVSVSGSAVQAQTGPPGNIQATAASLDAPAGIAYDAAGNLYIADLNHNVIREVTVAGIITTIAGTGEQGFAGDGGPAISALLDSPAGIAVDTAGNVYIADTHNNRIRKVTAGTISTIAGTGIASFSGDGGSAAIATLNHPTAIASDVILQMV
jgi:hypothetical protein